jgi:hypothetical protein
MGKNHASLAKPLAAVLAEGRLLHSAQELLAAALARNCEVTPAR